MQLAAAATAEDEADDLDCSATAQSSMQVLHGGCSHDHRQQQQQQQQQLGMYGSQSATPPAITDDALESHLLQQLLQDMQLSPQLQQQQQQLSPLLQQQAMQALPSQLVVQQSAMQSSLLPPQQLPLQHAQQQQHQASQQQQQQQRQLLEHIQQQLQVPAQQQQQLQPPRQLSPEQMQQLEQPSYSSYLPQPSSGAITQSCPLPNAASDNWQGSMRQSSNKQGLKSLSSALPVWQQQQQQQVEMSESASMTFKKRDRQQLFQQLLQGTPAAVAAANLMWQVHDCKGCENIPNALVGVPR
jgi:hypothetical protein